MMVNLQKCDVIWKQSTWFYLHMEVLIFCTSYDWEKWN